MASEKKKKRYLFIILASVFLALVLASFAVISVNSVSCYDRSNRLFSGEKYFYYNGQLIIRDPDIRDNLYKQEYFRMKDGRLYYEEEGVSSWFGIDVSGYQDWIRWSRVAQDGVQFAFIRLGNRGYSSGIIYKDSKFEYNYTEARRNGIPVGLYFFSQALNDEEAVEEADYILRQLNGRVLDLPIVFDWEYVAADARTGDITPEALTSACDAFCRRIEESGYSAMVYTNLYTAYNRYNFSEISDKYIWLAQFNDYPTFRYYFDVFQYSCTGKVHGIDGEVDLNIMFVDPKSFLKRTGSV
ncbi:MAG: glycoside hydrolase family 25 protein [Oscillospiraceae bacterium]|nr:glycoside hydrolase family 25 protein [Oscillospiraceae bacterium]MBR5070718.1 glycoside hydrolase family 25 protein [Oscillospiraceae bacterium]